MQSFTIKVQSDGKEIAREDQLAWKIACVAADMVAVEHDVAEMIINRIIDNAAVAIAAINTGAVVTARSQALARPRSGGATIIGCRSDQRVHAEWGAWANGAAVRQLDWSDAYGGLTYSHPSDNIPAMIAAAQQIKADGPTLIRGIAAAYEIQIDLTSGIMLHEFGIDQVAHLGPSVAAGVASMMRLPVEQAYWAVQQAAYVSTLTRQDRTGEITSWKGHAPGHVGKLAIEAVDRCLYGEHAPTPIYEGSLGLIAVLLGGKEKQYTVALPAQGEPKRALLLSFPKQWSAEYEAQPFIDLVFRMRGRIKDLDQIEKIVITGSNHMDVVIGTGSHDPEKFNPDASRETLDHSLMYIVAVALQDGTWDYIKSYLPERAHRPDTIKLWKKISTVEDPAWTKRYHDPDPKKRVAGGRIDITMADKTVISDEIENANAHLNGATPWKRADYIDKFRTLTKDVLAQPEIERFLALVQRLPELRAEDLDQIHPILPEGKLEILGPQLL